MMKHRTIARATALTATAAFMYAGVSTLSAADAPAAKAAAKPAAKAQPAPAKPAPKTLEEAFAFLPDTVAEVGSKKITKKDFLKQLGNVPVEYIAQLPPEMLKPQAQQMINAMAEMELLLELAGKAGIQPTREMLLAELDNEFKKMPKDQRDLFEKQLKLQGKTFEDVKKQMLEMPNALNGFAIQKFVKEKITPGIKISDADIEKFYRENPDNFKMPEVISASHILISTMPDANAKQKPDAAALKKKDQEAKAKAEKILAQLKQGADFGALAEKESACPSGKNKGKLGEFPRGQMVPEFEAAAFALSRKGEISGVVKTQFGYHIIRLDEKKPARVMPLADVKESIRQKLQGEALQKAVADVVAKAKKEIKFVVADLK